MQKLIRFYPFYRLIIVYLLAFTLLALIGEVGYAATVVAPVALTAVANPTTAGYYILKPTPTLAIARTQPASPIATPSARVTASVTGPISIARTIPVTKTVPLRLQIPKFQIDAVIESVGSDQKGNMDAPHRVADVAWYAPGSAPGEVGNAVIAGHLDRADGSPAVFWPIGQLKAGDEVIVVSANHLHYHFRVVRVQSYPYNAAPLDEIFGFALHSQLNLITCHGVWNQGARNYSKRLVVYTELIKITPE